MHLNGWQRIWIALTGLGLVSVVIASWLLSYSVSSAEWNYRRSIEKDFANPDCKKYSSLPMQELTEPARIDDGGCWHIYTSRRYSETDKVPYTLAAYDREKSAYRFNQFLFGIGMLGAGVLVLSALVYCAGWLVSWVRKGFVGT